MRISKFAPLVAVTLAIAFIVAAAPAATAVTVYFSSPSSSNVGTSFVLNANATSGNSITGWCIYVDGIENWCTPGPTSSISRTINVGAGSHTLHVNAWDSSGAVGFKEMGISASGGGTSTPPAPSSGGVDVSIQSPGDGSNVSNPVTFTASGSSPNGISGWVIYMDGGANLYQVDNNSNSLSATVNVPSGWHNIYIRAWDRRNGTYGTTGTISINANGSSSASSGGSGLPSVPSDATVFYDINNNNFSSCSANCAGGNSTNNYWQAGWQGDPSLDGSSRQFFNGGGPWANVLWYKEWAGYSWASNFLWDFWVLFDDGIWNLHTAEFDSYSANSGVELMAGSQCNFGDGVWDIWDQDAGRWISTNISCRRFSPGSWHHIQWYVTRPSYNRYKYVTLVVDGTAYSIDQTFYGSANGWADKVGVQFQLDLGPDGIAAHEWVDKVKLSIW